MARYSVFLTATARKQLAEIPRKDRERIVDRIAGLADDPRPPGCEKLSLQERYRIRQGDYRVIYGIDDEQVVVRVIRVGHRRDVYRG